MAIARILLVEDDPVSRDIIAALLVSRGHQVETVDDGFGALRLAQDASYDLVFVDYHLPEMDGYAFARLLRSLSEASNSQLKMIAITADRFGLAARRGVDSVFDRVLTKPIDPDTLFAYVDEFLGERSSLEELDTFLAETAAQETNDSAQTLWREQGIAPSPAAAVFPAPTAAERKSLEHCFRIVEPAQADCLIVLRQAGLFAVEALRATDKRFLQPLLVLDASLATQADIHFQVGDPKSWSRTAATLKEYAARAANLDGVTGAPIEFDRRLMAYLYVADRALRVGRDAAGKVTIPYAGGFAEASVIEAIKRLAARGLVAAKPDGTDLGETRALVVTLTVKGIDLLTAPKIEALNAG